MNIHSLSANVALETIGAIHDSLQDVLNQLHVYDADIETINNMASTIIWLDNEYIKKQNIGQIEIKEIEDLSAELVNFI